MTTGTVLQLCERVGFDVIIVETVGVGQSEIEIDNVVDFVVHVIPPGSGDSLQGSKKGIMEISDLIVINKCDGDYVKACQRLQRSIQSSLTLSRLKHFEKNWFPPVELVSALKNENIHKIWENAQKFKNQLGDEYLQQRRNQQTQRGMWVYLGDAIMTRIKDYNDTSDNFKGLMG